MEYIRLPKCSGCGSTEFDNQNTCLYCGEKNETIKDVFELIKPLDNLDEYYEKEIYEKLINNEKLNEKNDNIFRNLLKNCMILDDKLPDGIILMNIMKNRKQISYETFEWLLKISIEKEMKRINGKKIDGYSPMCHILELKDANGFAFEQIYVTINKDVCASFYEKGDLNSFIIIYHELRHIMQNIAIKIGFFSSDLPMMIKDNLIRKEEVKKYKTDNYYSDNYYNISFEIDARKYSLLYVINFLNYFGYKVSDSIFEPLKKEFIHDYSDERRVMINGKEEYKDVNDVFDLLISRHCEYLDLYPQLKLEYIKDGQIVRRKTRDELIDSLLLSENEEEKAYLKKLLKSSKPNLNPKKTM